MPSPYRHSAEYLEDCETLDSDWKQGEAERRQFVLLQIFGPPDESGRATLFHDCDSQFLRPTRAEVYHDEQGYQIEYFCRCSRCDKEIRVLPT